MKRNYNKKQNLWTKKKRVVQGCLVYSLMLYCMCIQFMQEDIHDNRCDVFDKKPPRDYALIFINRGITPTGTFIHPQYKIVLCTLNKWLFTNDSFLICLNLYATNSALSPNIFLTFYQKYPENFPTTIKYRRIFPGLIQIAMSFCSDYVKIVV